MENDSQKRGLEVDVETKENEIPEGPEVATTSVQGGHLGHEDKTSFGLKDEGTLKASL